MYMIASLNYEGAKRNYLLCFLRESDYFFLYLWSKKNDKSIFIYSFVRLHN